MRPVSPRTLFVLAITAAALGGAVIVWIFGEENFLVELAAGFGASLLAFAVALSWERDRELREIKAEDSRREDLLLADEVREENEAKKEIRRLLTSVATEIEMNGRGLDQLTGELAQLDGDSSDRVVPVLPLLFDGVWTANAPRLVQIADYSELIGDLATFYGEIDELRFRLRYRTQTQTSELDAGIRELLRSASDRIKKLHETVERVAADPIVGPLRLTRPLRVLPPLRLPERPSKA